MGYLDTYVNEIRDRGNHALADSIQKTADYVGKNYLEKFTFITNEVGLLLGNIQSGKTGQMFGIVCKAADLGFPVFLMLTTDNVVLQQQTLERVQKDLGNFCICGENDAQLFSSNNLRKPTIVVLKKNARMLKLWDTIFHSTDFMKGNPLFIVDDEADAASLNTKVNQRSYSSINKYLNHIKSSSTSSLYLQVTGTPQALFLQAEATGWHPSFTYYFQPGKGYLGGDFFFKSAEPDKKHISIIEKDENAALSDAVLHHLAASAQLMLGGRKVCNFMIHPSVRTAKHSQYSQKVCKILGGFEAVVNQDSFVQSLKEMYDKTLPEKTPVQSFEKVYAFVKSLLLDDKVKVIILNGKNDVDSSEYAEGSNIIIGGNTLGRGVTFDALETVFYTRSSKTPQADTMWQHSRMFGYDRDKGLVRVYIDQRLYDLFHQINDTNNAMIAQIERGLDNVHIFYPNNLKPTRNNVLDKKKVSVIPGGQNFFPTEVDNDDISAVDALLNSFDEKVKTYQVSLKLMRQVLDHIKTDNFPMDAFKTFLDSYMAKLPTAQGILIVRRNRDIRKGSRALLSPDDWDLGGSIHSKVVLTMYKMNGNPEKGWAGRQVWVPNIKLPDDVVYYDVHDIPEEEQEPPVKEEYASYGAHKVNAYQIDRRKSAEKSPKY